MHYLEIYIIVYKQSKYEVSQSCCGRAVSICVWSDLGAQLQTLMLEPLGRRQNWNLYISDKSPVKSTKFFLVIKNIYKNTKIYTK